MLFRSLVISALAGLVAADCASILASLALIDADTMKLDSDIATFNGNILFALPVLGDNIKLNSDLINGTSIAKGSSELSMDEALSLVAPVQKLASDVNVAVTDLMDKHAAFKSNNLTGIVLVTLEATKGGASDYSTAIISKIPTSLQETAQGIVAPINDVFNKAISTYQD